MAAVLDTELIYHYNGRVRVKGQSLAVRIQEAIFTVQLIGLLYKLKYLLSADLLRMIYNSFILPHMNYSLLAWGSNCHSIELLQKKAVRVVNFKPPVVLHTEPIL